MAFADLHEISAMFSELSGLERYEYALFVRRAAMRDYHANRYARVKADQDAWKRYIAEAKGRRHTRLANETPKDRDARLARHREACRRAREKAKGAPLRRYSRTERKAS